MSTLLKWQVGHETESKQKVGNNFLMNQTKKRNKNTIEMTHGICYNR